MFQLTLLLVIALVILLLVGAAIVLLIVLLLNLNVEKVQKDEVAASKLSINYITIYLLLHMDENTAFPSHSYIFLFQPI